MEAGPRSVGPAWTARDLEFKAAFDAVELHLERRYGLPVKIGDVLDPNTGDFDGAQIVLDHDNDIEVAVFVLAHLFGHTVQWSTDERARELGTTYASSAPPPELFEAVRTYERDASRLALQCFHEAGVRTLDGWMSDWAAADWGYLEHFYRTGERADFRRFFKAGTPVIEPMPIPAFTPKRWVSRYSF
jgi:hypothetical protein